MISLWQALARIFSGKPEDSLQAAIPPSAELAISTLRQARFAADQETRALRDLDRRGDVAAVIRKAQQQRGEAR